MRLLPVNKHKPFIPRNLSGQGTEFINKEVENRARQRGLHLATSHQRQSNGLAERVADLAKQTTKRLFLCSGLPDGTCIRLKTGCDPDDPEFIHGLRPRSVAQDWKWQPLDTSHHWRTVVNPDGEELWLNLHDRHMQHKATCVLKKQMGNLAR